MPGTLLVKPLTANLTRDTELFGTMDPYCKFMLGKQKVEGSVCKNGGKHPQWEETLVFRRINEPKINLELKEKDWLLPDGTIGSCDINLNEVEGQPRVLKWYNLSYTGKPVGKILLELSYEPDHSLQPVNHQNPFTTGHPVQPKKKEELPSGWVEVNNQPKVQPQATQIGPGVMHGYNPQNTGFYDNNQQQHGYNPSNNQFYDNNNNNNNQHGYNPQNNDFYNNNNNQNNQYDMFAPSAETLAPGQKYPTFDNKYYPNTYNQPVNNVPETTDYRNQQTGFIEPHNYPGMTQEALVPHDHHDKQEDSNSGWDPLRIIRGALGGRK